MTLDARARPWAARLEELVAAHGVPGAVLGVSWHGERVVFAAGVASLRSALPVTPTTVFQLGSISKLYTATLIVGLAAEHPGLLTRPVADVVPEAAWLGRDVRIEHLLTHSSGLAGDSFADTGCGVDCLARYVARLADLPRDVPGPPGRRYSYCNSGYSVLGRAIEVLTGTDFDTALRGRLLDPLGAGATSMLAKDTILQPVAVGHNRPPGGAVSADAVWNLPQSCAPLGGVCASADDLLAFAEMHLAGGRAASGARLLHPEAVAGMRARVLETPPLTRPSARGLGWGIFDWPGAELAGHDGETTGQIAKLRILPSARLALVVLTNSIPDGDEVARELENTVLADWGLTPPVLPTPSPDPGFDPRPFVGRYRNLEGVADVSARPGGLRVVRLYEAEGLSESRGESDLVALGDAAFVDADEALPTRAVRFSDRGEDGRYHTYFYGRVARRERTEVDERLRS